MDLADELKTNLRTGVDVSRSEIVQADDSKVFEEQSDCQLEARIEYGHLHMDLMQAPDEEEVLLNLGIFYFGMLAFAATFAPFTNLCKCLFSKEVLVWILELTGITWLIPHAVMLSHGMQGLIIIGTMFIMLWLLIKYLVLRGHTLNLTEPAQLIINNQGVSRLWFFPKLFSYQSRVRKWSELKGVIVEETEVEGAKHRKLILSYHKRKPIKIDFQNIRYEYELDVIRGAIEEFAPEHAKTEEFKKLSEDSAASTCHYTEIWTQSLLADSKRVWLSALPPGLKLNDDRIEIIRKVASGGQGTVYLARRLDLADSPEVVLKEYILPEKDQSHDRRRALRRFEKEVLLLSKISNERIVSLYDVFVEDQRAYLILEYVNGLSLRQLVERGKEYQMETIIEYGIQMSEILSYLHNCAPPIIHQDFTPDNLLVESSSNHIKLVDFNVTREEVSMRTNLVVGKQAFMPPEQFKGKASALSDVYALGCTLYYLHSGKEPEPLTVCHLDDRKNEVDEDFDSILSKSTALDSNKRYQSAKELQTDLENLLIKVRAKSSKDT